MDTTLVSNFVMFYLSTWCGFSRIKIQIVEDAPPVLLNSKKVL